jgi:hypothetical protein
LVSLQFRPLYSAILQEDDEIDLSDLATMVEIIGEDFLAKTSPEKEPEGQSYYTQLRGSPSQKMEHLKVHAGLTGEMSGISPPLSFSITLILPSEFRNLL